MLTLQFFHEGIIALISLGLFPVEGDSGIYSICLCITLPCLLGLLASRIATIKKRRLRVLLTPFDIYDGHPPTNAQSPTQIFRLLCGRSMWMGHVT